MAVPTSRFRPRGFLAAAWALNVCANAFYIAPAPVFPNMIRDLNITNAQAGALISVYLISILLFQVPAGYVVDRRDPRPIVAIASLALLGTSVATFLLPRYGTILSLRFVAGIPVAFVFAPSAFLISRAFPATPARAVGTFLSAPPTGVALGNLLGPIVASAFGWPSVFVAFTAPLVILVPLFAVTARGLPGRLQERFTLHDYVQSFRSIELWKVGAVFSCSYAAYIFYASWSPTYLSASGLGTAALVGAVSAAIPAAGILSRPVGGYLAEKRFAPDKRAVPALAFVVLALSAVAIPFLGLGSTPLLILGGFLAQLPFGVYYLFASQILPARFGGTAYAFMNTVSLIGGAIAPGLAGLLVDLTGSFVASFGMIAAIALLGLGLLARMRER
jgi:predicted MFS family arabinose efflux permease